MSELSATTGTSVPTLKFYVRERLLHPGERTSPNQARYDDTHVQRARLVRALLDVGGLTVARAREVIAAVDSGTVPLSSIFGIAQRAVTIPAPVDGRTGDNTPPSEGDRLVAELCAARGWKVHPNNPGLALAARVLDTYAGLGQQRLHAVLEQYAAAADLVAAADLAAVASAPDDVEMTNVVVVGTVLGDALFAGLRRISQEAESFRRFPLPEGAPAPRAATDPEDAR